MRHASANLCSIASLADNQFSVLASGGVRFYTSSAYNYGVTLDPNDSSWNNVSDRNVKENFEAVDTRGVLAKVAALPISEWNLKAQDASKRHIGPMAQDFHAAFGLNGPDDRHINTSDIDGVALAAIQGLNQKLVEELQQKDTEISELKQRLERLERLMNPSLTGGGQ